MPSGILLIERERLRQIIDKGFTLEHDRRHANNELAWMAVHYAAPSTDGPEIATNRLPLPAEHDKRAKYDRIRQLAIAGACCAAEIDLLMSLEKGAASD